MNRKLVTVYLTVVLTLSATKIRLEDPRSMKFHDEVDFTPHEVVRETLSNGIRVFFAENHELPLVDFYVAVRAGEVRVPLDAAGLSEILAYLIVEGGSQNVQAREFRDSLENFGASFSVQSGSKYVDFSLHLLSKNIPALLPLAVEAIRYPGLPPEQLEINKEQYLSSYQGRNNDPSSVTTRIYWKLIYGKDSPAAREITPASLENIKRGSLRSFHMANYRPSHVLVGVSGDFDPSRMLELLEQCLGDWNEPETEPYLEQEMVSAPARPGIYLVNWPEAVQTNIRMGYLSFLRNEPGYPEALLLTEIYGSSRFSRMRLVVREKHGLAYSPYGWVSAGLTEPGTFSTVVATKTSRTLEALNLLAEIIEDLRTNGVSEEDLMLAKESWLASFPAHYSRPSDVLRDRMLYARYSYPLDFWDMLEGKIRLLTLADVNGFAADFLSYDDLIILVVGDSSSFDGTLSKLGKVDAIDALEY